MTDYLEELLDQLEEEEAETAAHWMDALRPALFDPLSESSGSAGRCGRLPGFCSTGGLGGHLVPCPAGGEAV